MTNIKQEEVKLIHNIISKLQICMDKTGQNLFSLAKSMKFDYQPFYRLMKKNHLPTISSLFLIAKQLNCTIQELIDDKVFIDTPIYKTINITSLGSPTTCRIYLQLEDYLPIQDMTCFSLLNNTTQLLDVYYLTNKFISDGVFIVLIDNKHTLKEITSVSSKFIIVMEKGIEIKIPITDIIPVAKLFKSMKYVNSNSYGVFND